MEARDHAATTEPGRVAQPPGEEARASLRRARKALGADWSNKDASAPFYIEEAKVLALLELASAIRGANEAQRPSASGPAAES